MKALINYLTNRIFLKNLGIAVGILVFFLIFTMTCMRVYTNHNKSYAVLDLYDIPQEEAIRMIEGRGFRYIIFDSIYVPEKEPGVILDQHPRPGFLVKKNRKIFLTINASEPEKIPMPKLVELTFREGKAKLESFGLMLGNLSYKYDLSRNVILEQKVNGNTIEPGDSISKGAYVDLVLGKGLGNEKEMVPNLVGLTVEEAKAVLLDALFSLGYSVPDNTVDESSDSLAPKIFRQKPISDPAVRVPLGSTITVWITKDSTKLSGYNNIKEEDLIWKDDENEEVNDTEIINDNSTF
jgi:beta-lactam-binding protein with PASTA domain